MLFEEEEEEEEEKMGGGREGKRDELRLQAEDADRIIGRKRQDRRRWR